MYTPASFAVTEKRRLHDFIRQHSFATLVTCDHESQVTHLPLLLDTDHGDGGQLVGHMARANPQWQHLEGRTVLAIFHGPHAYISPSWLAEPNVVPTWNYVAVHARGTFRLKDARSDRAEILRDYVEQFEQHRESRWSIDRPDPDFVDSLIDAVVGFTVDIEQLEGKWKLSQNHSVERRQQIIHGLAEEGGEMNEQMAELMTKTCE